jgi:glycosyltransferase involved in cell wall biosynthesis
MSSPMPTFSVVIPLYNRRHAIGAAIRSVQRQTFQDFEIVVVDDGSKDKPEEAIAAIAEPRLRLIGQENRGGSAARNAGIDAARGRHVAFLDSDDAFLPHHLEQAHAYLRSVPDACTYSQVIVDRGDEVTFLKPPRARFAGEHIADYLMLHRGFVPTSTLTVPRALAAEVRYDEELAYGQDLDFAIRLVSHGAALVMLEEPGAIWRDRDDAKRVSSRLDPQQRLIWLERVKPLLTSRSYWSHLGSAVARGHAYQGRRTVGLLLYAGALLRGAYRPKLALVVLLQILLRPVTYRRLSNRLAKWGVTP